MIQKFNGQVKEMAEITKETAMLNFLFNILYGADSDKDFIEQLKEALSEEDMKSVLASSDEKTRAMFTEPFSIDEIKYCLKKANEIFEEQTEKNNIILMKKLESFANADFLKDYFLSDDNMFDLKISESSVFIEEYYDSVLRRITFENARVYHNGELITDESIDLFFHGIEVAEDSGVYIFEFRDYFTDECYSINFENIAVSLKAYSAESDYLFWLFVKTPWDYIFTLANNINAHFKCGVETAEEKQIFGLVKHLTGEHYTDLDSVPAELYSLIKKHKLENKIKPPYDLSKPYLCKKKYEPFWRDVFCLVAETQKNLPSYFEESVSKEAFEKHKRLITAEMNKWGYTGVYPDYYKKDSIKKPTLLKTYNLSHVIAYEKFVEHHIHCYSFENENVIHTTFFVGTIFNKKDTDTSDIYSTMFDFGGRAVFSILSTMNAGAMDKASYEIRTQKAVKAAAKKADLKKTDKDDYYFKSLFERNARLNFKALIFMLVFFSVGFSMIAPILLIVLEGCSFSEIVAIMKDEPLFILTGIIGGFVATFLVALFEWLSGKK